MAIKIANTNIMVSIDFNEDINKPNVMRFYPFCIRNGKTVVITGLEWNYFIANSKDRNEICCKALSIIDTIENGIEVLGYKYTVENTYNNDITKMRIVAEHSDVVIEELVIGFGKSDIMNVYVLDLKADEDDECPSRPELKSIVID